MKSLILIVCLSFTLSSWEQTREYAGSYSYGDTIPSGSLEIYPESDTTLLFNISLVNSHYHMGNNTGRIYIRHDSAIYDNTNKYMDMNCKLLFQFKSKKVIVKTLDSREDCGYGAWVYSDGVYKKDNNKIPTYYFSPEGDTLYFRDFNKLQADTIPVKHKTQRNLMDDTKK